MKDVVLTNFRRDSLNKVKPQCIYALKEVVDLDIFSAQDIGADQLCKTMFETCVASKPSQTIKVGCIGVFGVHSLTLC